VVVSATEVLGAGASEGATGTEVVDAGHRLGDSIGSLLQDLVVRGTGAGIPGSATPCDTALAIVSSRVVGPGISGLY
jgi:hypothetical protein